MPRIQDLSALEEQPINGIDIEKPKGSTDASIKARILSFLEFIPEEIQTRLYRLSDNKRDDLLNEIASDIYAKIMDIKIFKNAEKTTPANHRNIFKAINIFSPAIIEVLLEINLRYRFSMLEEKKDNLPIETRPIVKKALESLLDKKDYKELKKFKELISKIPENEKLEVLKNVFEGAHLDLTQIMTKLKRPIELDSNVFFDLFISMMSSVSKALLLTRMGLEVILHDTGRKRKEEITAVSRDPNTSGLLDLIESIWDNNQNFYLFTIELNGKKGHFYRQRFKENLNSILKHLFGSVSKNYTLVQTGPKKYFLSIISENESDMREFFNEMAKNDIIQRSRPDVAMTFIRPHLFDEKLRKFKGHFRKFLNEVVIESIMSHLQEGIDTLEKPEVRTKGIKIACGSLMLNEENFSEVSPEELSATQITHIYPLTDFTVVAAFDDGFPTLVDPLAEIRALEMEKMEERKPSDGRKTVEENTANLVKKSKTQDSRCEETRKARPRPIQLEETKPVKAQDLIQGIKDTANATTTPETGEMPQEEDSSIFIIQEEPMDLIEEDSQKDFQVDPHELKAELL
ncbi:MAG: hypothetical protein RBS56_03850 [Candidatus Gracilibacteria bacterium]|jgi:hypothetical protein|nr:hypothetical protein [Candidatus Gracilibacteria bacterium]